MSLHSLVTYGCTAPCKPLRAGYAQFAGNVRYDNKTLKSYLQDDVAAQYCAPKRRVENAVTVHDGNEAFGKDPFYRIAPVPRDASLVCLPRAARLAKHDPVCFPAHRMNELWS